jgi:hypothetical protein
MILLINHKKEIVMKKFFIFLIYFSIPLLIVACGGGESPQSTSQNETSPSIENEVSSTTVPRTVTTNQTPTATPLVEETSPSIPASKEKQAFNNMGKIVEADFNTYTLKLLSDKTLTQAEVTSPESIVVYGTINQKATNALLKINANYRESNLTLQVFDNALLVYQKEHILLTNQIAVNFGNLQIH